MKNKPFAILLLLGLCSGCGIFNNGGNYIDVTGYDSLFVLAHKDTLNLNVNSQYDSSASFIIIRGIDSLLMDTIKLKYHVFGKEWNASESLVNNFSFENDTLFLYIGFIVFVNDSLSANFRILGKKENHPAPEYAKIDTLFIYSSKSKYVNAY